MANVIDKEWVWIVDPLDGTTNYVYALPLSVVSICVAHKVWIVIFRSLCRAFPPWA